ncbi:hypothetical protein Bca4012_071029 [Brassica carinata]|uniref:F-box domain-containing protein n=1 Tax=Brassica carinata TaxID=52824 RepID=A0A8X7U7K3_BRACI|nr:hypothetical protein Bca52824_063312 [Brassica carinata]
MENPNNLSLLESLPRDLLGEILSRVASSSRQSIRNCLTVSRRISSAVQDDPMNPLVTYEAYHNLMEICLRSGNPVSHYIEGIKLYFVQESTAMGLFHLKKSAEGNQAEGTEFLRSLGWETSRCRADRCWRENRLALRFVIIPMKDEYTININTHAPEENCHLNDLDTRCKRCYIYKQMWKFFELINEHHI